MLAWALRRRRRLVAACVAAGAIAALALLAAAPDRHAAEAVIEIAAPAPDGWSEAPSAPAPPDAAAMETERRLLLSREAMERVAARLDLAATPGFSGPGGARGLAALWAGPAEAGATDTIAAARRLAARVTAERLGDSRLIALRAVAAEPTLARRIVEALVADRLAAQSAARGERAAAAAERLARRLATLEQAGAVAAGTEPDAGARPRLANRGDGAARTTLWASARSSPDAAGQAAPPSDDARLAPSRDEERRTLAARLAAARLAAATAAPDARVVSAAAPVPPDLLPAGLTLALGLGGGLALGGALAWLRETQDGAPLSAAMAAADAGAPTLAALPRVRGRLDPVVQARRRPGSPLAEGARRLRQALATTADARTPGTVVAVLSPGPGEGKSTVAALLAESCALAGLRTALVDADLRAPSQARRYGVAGAADLLSALGGEATVEQALSRPVERGPWLLPADPAGARRAELLAGPAMARLVAELRRRFDVVILDTPPLLCAAEARTLATLADRRVLALRWGETRRGDLRAAADALREAGAPATGLALCAAPRRGGPDPAARRPRYGGFLEGFDV
ncbi:Wzz/FepE/Etk N-terminal domain-containing protein [Albimonas sp. CAU 1670]|uniref:tyrosine-protein kinase domain-containing protein n=1 Tax=Albimonas sp. CAU 1670 TaxID=3032599 RepID=UPI0023DB8846|nr:tyrosine-protein kinase domain-containing protein [Albimonas sp. CAU 1670]MDF2235588.1 Wzz/FepE/Etk N-terminal domain-containing protein [Albimonas sp. CAU 1670]